jgi:TonB family protein
MTNRRGFGFRYLVAAVLFALATHVDAQDTVALVERLRRATALNSIDDAEMKPWHLKMSFQLFDEKGKPTETGAIEEWWSAPSMHKTIYTSPSYTSTEVQTKDGLYRSKGAATVPNLLQLALQQVVHPMPTEGDIADSKPDMRTEKVDKTPMDCIMLSQPIKNIAYPPLGLFPTYCFDRDKDSLRISYDFGSQLRVRNKLGTFQQRTVVIDQTTLQNSTKEITAHVESLQSVVPHESDTAVSADLEEARENQVLVSSGVMAGLRLSGVNPSYPAISRGNHVSGSVILRARIGSDGHIQSLKVISTPDADLAIAALVAVRQWTYKPYRVNGEPVGVDTQLTVNFSTVNFTFRN